MYVAFWTSSDWDSAFSKIRSRRIFSIILWQNSKYGTYLACLCKKISWKNIHSGSGSVRIHPYTSNTTHSQTYERKKSLSLWRLRISSLWPLDVASAAAAEIPKRDHTYICLKIMFWSMSSSFFNPKGKNLPWKIEFSALVLCRAMLKRKECSLEVHSSSV